MRHHSLSLADCGADGMMPLGRRRMRGCRMRWLTLIVALMLGACGTLDNVPTQAELQAQWDALNVFPQRYKSDILSLMRNYLNDPTNVRDAGITQPQLKKVGPGDRYVVCVRFNARNSDRKYT